MTDDRRTFVSGRFDDALARTALVFPRPDRVLTARQPADVAPLLDTVDRATQDGAWAFGFLAYEAAAGLDPGCAVAAGKSTPLAWFGIGAAPHVEALVPARSGAREYWCSDWQLDTTREQHRRAVVHAQCEIAAGNIYQANLTSRARAVVRGDLLELYADLVHAQQASYNAFLDLGDVVVLSASPELFFEWAPPMVRCRPMKGTARRGLTEAEDDLAAAQLSASTKDIAENVMIVDLVRNDLGRIARTGSVRVPRLCVREQLGSVWQLSSEVEAEPRGDVMLADILIALFPSGSITGVPKRAAMSVIGDLEPDPRGVYTGAIGWVAPPDNPTRAMFNVAIRTVVVDSAGSAVYGAGGGITTASDPDGEFDELVDKTAVLAVSQDDCELELLETLAFVRSKGFVYLERHLSRIANSAAYFGFPFDDSTVRDALVRAVGQRDSARVGLRLRENGAVAVRVAALPDALGRPVRLAVDSCPVRSDSLWQRHKTNRRDRYDAAIARHPDVDDVVMINEDARITETTVANLAVRIEGRWWTPPLESGCLPGIGRAAALDRHAVAERDVTLDDLQHCDEVALISSLRGWRTAILRGT